MLKPIVLFAALSGGMSPAISAPIPRFKTFVDPKYGVSFRDPAGWNQDGTLGFYLGSLILLNPDSSNGPDQPRVKVGFERRLGPDGAYSDKLNLDGVQFVYLVLPDSSRDTCYARLGTNGGDGKRSQEVIHGVTYGRLQGGDAGLGHGAFRDMYAAFQNDRCYLFEGDIETLTANNTRFLGGSALRKLEDQIAKIMKSVTIRTPGPD